MDMKFEVVPPNYVAIYQFSFFKVDRIQVFVVLRMRMYSNELSDIDISFCVIVKNDIYCNVVITGYFYDIDWSFHGTKVSF